MNHSASGRTVGQPASSSCSLSACGEPCPPGVSITSQTWLCTPTEQMHQPALPATQKAATFSGCSQNWAGFGGMLAHPKLQEPLKPQRPGELLYFFRARTAWVTSFSCLKGWKCLKRPPGSQGHWAGSYFWCSCWVTWVITREVTWLQQWSFYKVEAHKPKHSEHSEASVDKALCVQFSCLQALSGPAFTFMGLGVLGPPFCALMLVWYVRGVAVAVSAACQHCFGEEAHMKLRTDHFIKVGEKKYCLRSYEGLIVTWLKSSLK